MRRRFLGPARARGEAAAAGAAAFQRPRGHLPRPGYDRGLGGRAPSTDAGGGRGSPRHLRLLGDPAGRGAPAHVRRQGPGPEPLFHSLTRIEHIVQRAAGRRLRSIEAYDILMWAAKAVLSGGVRRSATICLFSADDEEMAAAKTGNWFQDNPQRTASNNSAVIVRAEATRAQFNKLFEAQKAFGEPGFYFVEDPEYGANPCVEIGLHPRLKLDAGAIARLRELGYSGELREGETLTGVQFCNLTTVSAAAAETPAPKPS